MILINGCSHTHGTDWLHKNNQKNWATIFSEMTGKDVTNIAQAGCSWTSICYSTVEWLEKNEKPEEIICAFPEIYRLSFPSTERLNYETSNGKILDNSFREWTKDFSIFPNPDSNTKQPMAVQENYWMSSPHNWIWHYEQSLHSMNYLINVCENKNIPLKFIFWSEKVENIINHLQKNQYEFQNCIMKYYGLERKNYFEILKMSKFHTSQFDQHNLIDIVKKYDMFPERKVNIHFASKLNGHFGIGDTGRGFFDTHHDENGHRWLAERIVKKHIDGVECDFEEDDFEKIKSALEKQPDFKNTPFYEGVKTFLDHGIKHINNPPQEFFVYD